MWRVCTCKLAILSLFSIIIIRFIILAWKLASCIYMVEEIAEISYWVQMIDRRTELFDFIIYNAFEIKLKKRYEVVEIEIW